MLHKTVTHGNFHAIYSEYTRAQPGDLRVISWCGTSIVFLSLWCRCGAPMEDDVYRGSQHGPSLKR